MKTNIATDNLQSQRLLRCGVSADTADMFYQTPITVSQKGTRKDVLLVRTADKTLFNTDIPAWSLSALLGLLPKEIDIDGYPYRISIHFENPDEPVIGNQWCLYYKPKKHTERSSRIDDVAMYAPDLIGCAVDMIIWLINYGYKLNVIEKGGEEK